LVCKYVGVSYSELFLFNVYSILVYTLILEIEGRARKGRARRVPGFEVSWEDRIKGFEIQYQHSQIVCDARNAI
jgi:hypothetical protein